MRRQGLLLACHFFVTFAAVASLSAADILWTNSAGGNWHVAANWNPNQVPAAGDTAFITNRGDYTVILNADASVASLFLGGSEGGQAITIGGSTLTMNGPARINSNSLVAVTGGTIGGSGDLRVEGVLNFFGGSLLGSQPVVVAPSGQLLIGGSVNLGGRSVHNSGRMIWTSGNISNVSSVVNLPGGVIDALVSNDSVLTGTQVFTNGGTLRRSLGTNTVTFNMPFHNGGTAQIQSGRVLLNQEVLHTGTLIVAAGATLQVGVGLVSNPPADFSTGSFVTGAGHAILYNADIRGSFHVGGSNIFTGGTVNVMSGYVLSNAPLQILAGTVNFNSGRMLTPSAVTLTGGTLAGADSMSVTGSIRVVPGPVRLQSSGILNGNGGFTISGDLSIFSGTVNNGGASSVLSGALRLWSNSVFNNLPGATIHYAGASHIGEPEMPGTLNNHGLFVKTGGFKGIAARFNNHGEMDIQGGILFLSEGGSHSGSFRVGAGSTLRFDPGLLGAAHTLQESSQVTGDGNVGFGTSTDVRGSIAVAGDVSIVAGTNNFTGAFTNGGLLSISGGLATFSTGEPILPGSLSVSGGVLDGDDPITVRGPTSLTGGALSGSGAITANGGLTIGGTTLLLNWRTLNNRAYANWNGGFIFTGGGSVISNAAPGVFNINFDGQTFAGFGGNRRFVNAGVLRKSGGGGTAVISDAFFNMGTVESVSGGLAFGNVFMQTAGSTLLNGGNLGASGPLQIDGGVFGRKWEC
jgi:hypothetical protein